MSEKGHIKNLEHFKKARAFAAGWGAKYVPTNPVLLLTNLDAVIADAEGSWEDVGAALIPYRNATAAAADLFDPLSELVTRVVSALKISGVPDSVVEDAKTYARKIKGARKTPKPGDDPSTPDVDESEKSHSASQMSRAQRIENLDSLILLLNSHTLYKPNEVDLKTATLAALSDALKTSVDAVTQTFVEYSNKLAKRDGIFYKPGTGLIYVGRLFKGYVQSFGRNSAEWNQIKDLKFNLYKRRS